MLKQSLPLGAHMQLAKPTRQHVAAVGSANDAIALVSLSASFSNVGPSPVKAQSPFVSALEIAELNFTSAAVRQLESTAAPVETAFSMHFNLLSNFFPAAFIFATAHFCPGVAPA
jgi:hypothetical protein